MALLLVSFTHRQRHLAHGYRSSGHIPQGFSKGRFDCGNDCSLHKRRVTQDTMLALLRWEHLQRHLSAASIHKSQQHPVIGIHLLNCLLYQVSAGSKITCGGGTAAAMRTVLCVIWPASSFVPSATALLWKTSIMPTTNVFLSL